MDIAKYGKDTAASIETFAKDNYASSEATVQRVLDVQLPIVEKMYASFQAGKTRFEDVFRPLADAFVSDATSYNTEARRELEAGKAAATARQATEAARKGVEQRLAGYGIDPSQIRSQALDTEQATNAAAVEVAAANTARTNVENTGRALTLQGINIGNQEQQQSNIEAGFASDIGKTALTGRLATTTSGVTDRTAIAPLLNVGTGAAGSSANVLDQNYQSKLAQYNATTSPMDVVGLVGGIAASTYGGQGWKLPGESFRTAEGGAIPEGHVQAPGGPRDDTTTIRISNDEYVIPADVVKRKGTEFLDKLISKTREDLKTNARTAKAVPVSQLPPLRAAIPGGM